MLYSAWKSKINIFNGFQSRRVTNQWHSFLMWKANYPCCLLSSKVASSHGDHNINVTDLRTSKCISTLTGHPRTPWCIAFHPHRNDILASGCLGGQVRVWDLSVSITYMQNNYFSTYPHAFYTVLIHRAEVKCGR